MKKDPTQFRQRFQRWKNGELVYDAGLPYPMRTSTDYDDARAYELGYEPDENGHMPSRDYLTGRYLKSAGHPTESLAIYNDLGMGYDVYRKNNHTYSNPNFGSTYKERLPKYKYGTPAPDYIDRAVLFIADNEGFRSNVYLDTSANQTIAKQRGVYDKKSGKYGVPTSGYGWTAKKDLRRWTKEEAAERLKLDVLTYEALARDSVSTYDSLSPELKIAILDLYHQGGTGIMKRMPKFNAALNRGDIDAAYSQIDFGRLQAPDRNNRRKELFITKSQNNAVHSVAKPLSMPTAIADDDDKIYQGGVLPEVIVTPTRKDNGMAELPTLFPSFDEFMGEWMQQSGILTPYQMAKNLKNNQLAMMMPNLQQPLHYTT